MIGAPPGKFPAAARREQGIVAEEPTRLSLGPSPKATVTEISRTSPVRTSGGPDSRPMRSRGERDVELSEIAVTGSPSREIRMSPRRTPAVSRELPGCTPATMRPTGWPAASSTAAGRRTGTSARPR